MATKLEKVAAELYGLVPEEFTSARDNRAKDARAEGDRSLADQIRKLRKPKTAAWVLNRVVRERANEMDQVMSLGASLREAQQNLDGDVIRELDGKRRELTRGVTEQATTMAGRLGHPISDQIAIEVEKTLRAAMADEGGAAALRTGLLVDTFESTGFEPVDVARLVAVPSAMDEPERATSSRNKAAATTKRRKDNGAQRTRKRREAQQALDRARDVLRDAEQATEAASGRTEEARTRREGLEQEHEDLARRMRELDAKIRDAGRTERRAAQEQAATERDQAAAQRAIDRANAKVEKLG